MEPIYNLVKDCEPCKLRVGLQPLHNLDPGIAVPPDTLDVKVDSSAGCYTHRDVIGGYESTAARTSEGFLRLNQK